MWGLWEALQRLLTRSGGCTPGPGSYGAKLPLSGPPQARRHPKRPPTSNKALSAERWTPGRGSRGRPSFLQLSTGGGTAWLWHSRVTDSLATTDTFSSSPRMLGGATAGGGRGGSGGWAELGSTPAGGESALGGGLRPELSPPYPPLQALPSPAPRGGPQI